MSPGAPSPAGPGCADPAIPRQPAAADAGAPPGGRASRPPYRPSRRAVAAAMSIVFLAGLLAALAGAEVRSTMGGRAAVDEPQYLMSAQSLFDDANLDIDDELDAEVWRAYHDTNLPVQTQERPDGRQISPHDPLLPLLLAVPVGLGGLAAAKAALAFLAGATAAATLWVAVRRFDVGLVVATVGVGLAFASPPLAVYGQQVYPEMAAALAVVLAVGALTGPLRTPGLCWFWAAVVALPWLSVKYAPVAAALAAVALIRLLRARRPAAAVGLLAGLASAGAAYLLVHRAVWGGWTVYASGDHFQADGEFAVVGTEADYWGRAQRLAALLVDRDYGLAAWQPALLFVLPALGALCARRSRRQAPLMLPAVVLPAAAGWLVASFAALTMNGFWFPGRQVVVVLPLLVLLAVWWLDRAPAVVQALAPGVATVGVLALIALVRDGRAGEITWVGVARLRNLDEPVHHALVSLLPEYRVPGNVGLWPMHATWLAGFAVLALTGWAWARRTPRR